MELPPILKTPALLARSKDIVFWQHEQFVKTYGTGAIEILFTEDNNSNLKGKSKKTYDLWCSLALYGPIIFCLTASIMSNNWWLMFGILTAWVGMSIPKKRKIIIYIIGIIFAFVFYKNEFRLFETAPFLLIILIVNYWISNWSEIYKDTEVISRLITDEKFYLEMTLNYKVVVFKTNKS